MAEPATRPWRRDDSYELASSLPRSLLRASDSCDAKKFNAGSSPRVEAILRSGKLD